ncbi:MAG: hypothetical protein AAF634_11330 [Bacteroidota bacterium]
MGKFFFDLTLRLYILESKILAWVEILFCPRSNFGSEEDKKAPKNFFETYGIAEQEKNADQKSLDPDIIKSVLATALDFDMIIPPLVSSES